jgi:hypothetical protein
MKLTPEELALLDPSERELLTSDGAAESLGLTGNVASEDEPGEQTAAPAEGEQAEPTAEDGEGNATDEFSAEDLAALASDGEPVQKLPTYTIEATDFVKEKQTLKDQRKDIEKKWAEGEMTDEQRIEQLESIADQIETITRQQAKAEALAEINEQNQREATAKRESEFNSATAAIIKAQQGAIASGKQGVDYTKDGAAAKQFDALLTALEIDPANAVLTPAQLCDRAHKTVLALRGIVTAAPAPGPAPAPAARAERKVPPTLANLPNAGADDVSNDVLAKLEQLEGDEAEAFMASLPAATVKTLTKLADAEYRGNRRH